MIANNKYYKKIIEKLEDTSITGFHDSLYYMKKIAEFHDYSYTACVCSNKYLKDFAEAVTGQTYSSNLTNKEYLHDIAEYLGSTLSEDTENYYLSEIYNLITATPRKTTDLTIDVPLNLIYSDAFNITGTLLDEDNNAVSQATVNLLIGNTIVDTKVTNNQGVVSFTHTPVQTGNHSFQLKYDGDTSYKASSSSIVTRAVGKETSVLTVTSPLENSQHLIDSNIPVTGVLTDNDGTPLSNMSILIGTETVTTDSDGAFVGSVSYSSTGGKSIYIGYFGDDNYTPTDVNRIIIITTSYDSITLSGNKSILSHYDSDTCTLTAQLVDKQSNPVAVSDEIVNIYKDDVLLDTVQTDSTGKAQYVYSSQGSGDVRFKAGIGTVFSETYEVRDVHYYNDCTSNSVEDYFTVPYAVSSRSIYGFNSDGWKFGNCTSYQRIIGKEKLSDWFAIEFTVTEINGSGGLIQYIYSNGTTPNAGVLYDALSTNKWTIGDANLTHSFSIGTTVKIEWRSGTVTVYLNDELLGSGNHSVSLPTQVEFHTGTNRYVRIKDLIIETL